MKKNEGLFIEIIKNKQKINDLAFSTIMLLGSLGFLIAGISSYFKINILQIINTKQILFFPQGITMCFYGICGSLISSYQILVLSLEIGDGFNEFDKKNGKIKIFRKGYPWKERNIEIIYPMNDIEAIKVEKNTNLINSKQVIFICTKEKKEIPILQIKSPVNINEIEKEASELASFLQIPIKGV